MEVMTEAPHEPEDAGTPVTPSLADRLRRETARLHAEAEREPLQQGLLRGGFPRRWYESYLEQLLPLHRSLEEHLREHADLAGLTAVVRPEHFHTPRLERDLCRLRGDVPHAEPRPAMRRFLAWLAESVARNPIMLLGVHYVLEGSKNGSRFQAVGVARTLGLPGPGGEGTELLDPYGAEQPRVWDRYKRDLARQTFSKEEASLIVRAAQETFATFIEMERDIVARESGA